MIEMHKIPKNIPLPDFKIKVQEISKDQLVGLTGDPDVFAAWVSGKQTIYLDAEREPAAKFRDLVHETLHAVVDWLEHVGALGEPGQEAVNSIKQEFKQQIIRLTQDKIAQYEGHNEIWLLKELIEEIEEL